METEVEAAPRTIGSCGSGIGIDRQCSFRRASLRFDSVGLDSIRFESRIKEGDQLFEEEAVPPWVSAAAADKDGHDSGKDDIGKDNSSSDNNNRKPRALNFSKTQSLSKL